MFKSNCYKFNLEDKDWNGAESACNQVGAHLASVHSQDEASYIRCLQDPTSVHRTWIGGKRNGNEFQWIDGTPFEFDNWNTNQPNNYLGKEDCVEIRSDPGKDWHERWNDVPCESTAKFVCKKQPVGGK